MNKSKLVTITVTVPMSHYFGRCNDTNQYDLVLKLAESVHKGSSGDGGSGGKEYDMFIDLPENKVAQFKELLEKNNITNYSEND